MTARSHTRRRRREKAKRTARLVALAARRGTTPAQLRAADDETPRRDR